MPKPPADPVAELEIDLWLREGRRNLEERQFAKTIELCRRVLARRPTHPEALRQFSLAAFETGFFDVAEGFATQAVKSAPRSTAALCALGQVYAATNRPQQAVATFRKAQTIAPKDAGVFVLLGRSQLDLGDRASAEKSLKMALKLEPGNELAAHLLAGLNGEDSAVRNIYASGLFDSYASTFEQHLKALAYETPALLRAAVDAVSPGRRFAAALDLGCGTGLVAETFRDAVEAIDGIDIAPKMIEAASAKGLYRQLAVSDIADFLARPEAGAAYDLVVSADVFVYVGRLEDVFAAVRHGLIPAGLFAFSVEDLAEGDVAIRSTGRFAHSSAYLARLADEQGFVSRHEETVDLRKEHGTAIRGRIVVLEKA